jgi:hypothetical protein
MGAASCNPEYPLAGRAEMEKAGTAASETWGREEMAKAELHASLHVKIIIRAMGEIHKN